MTRGSFTTWSNTPTEDRPLSSCRLGYRSVFFLDDYINEGTWILEKDILWVLNCQEVFKKMSIHLKWVEQEFVTVSFLIEIF